MTLEELDLEASIRAQLFMMDHGVGPDGGDITLLDDDPEELPYSISKVYFGELNTEGYSETHSYYHLCHSHCKISKYCECWESPIGANNFKLLGIHKIYYHDDFMRRA